LHQLGIETTNDCNRNCIHCVRDKKEKREYLPLDLFQRIIDQSYDLGIRYVSLTGGEPTLYPDWAELLCALVERGLKFGVVTNGWKFKEKTLPLLLNPITKRHLVTVCFSLDGFNADSHDFLRGEGSFREVIEAANLCRLKRIPFSIKTVVSSINKEELTEIALLVSALGAREHSFISLLPTPRLVKENFILTPKESRILYSFISGSLIPSMKTRINLEGSWGINSALFSCNAYQQTYNVDYLGNLIFCCNLSHVSDTDKPATALKEFLGDLREESLREGIIRHHELLAQFTGDRLKDTQSSSELFSNPCYWCYKYFGKLEFIRKYPDSPWVKEMFCSEVNSHFPFSGTFSVSLKT